jgi:transcriptional regulator of heat shock response
MDPVTIVGLAFSVIQFIDLGSKIISTAKEIQESSLWMTKETERLQESATQLRDISTNMELVSNKELQSMAREGRDLSEQMLNLVQSIRSTDSGWFTKARDLIPKGTAIISSMRAHSKTSKLRELEKRLQTCRSQMQLHYNNVLW